MILPAGISKPPAWEQASYCRREKESMYIQSSHKMAYGKVNRVRTIFYFYSS
jgi:hypothetical protein